MKTYMLLCEIQGLNLHFEAKMGQAQLMGMIERSRAERSIGLQNIK